MNKITDIYKFKRSKDVGEFGMVSLAVDIAGVRLRNPTMLASGILGISGKLLRKVAKAGAGAVVTKSVSLRPKPGYLNPTIIEVDCGFINAMGLPNPGVDYFMKEVVIAKEGNVPVIASVVGERVEEFVEVALKLEAAGVDALELNVSCPHAGAGLIGQNAELTYEVVEAVKQKVKIPVFVKLTPNVTDITEIARAATDAGADAITAINTVKAMCIDIETGRPILSNVFGGLSGPAIKPIAIRCVYEIYRVVDVPIVGVGGICKWQDVVEFLMAGASAVQIGSGVIKGLSIFSEITEGLKCFLEKKGYEDINCIVGLAHRV